MAFDVGSITFLSIPKDALVQGGDPTKTVLVTVSGPFCWADLYITPAEALTLRDQIKPKLEGKGENVGATLSFTLNLNLKGSQVRKLVERVEKLDAVTTFLRTQKDAGPFERKNHGKPGESLGERGPSGTSEGPDQGKDGEGPIKGGKL